MYNYCIIGAGVTGLSLLLLLQEANIDLSTVTIVDPHFDGGDLARQWTTVLSNTPWSKSIEALRAACPRLLSTPQATSLINSVPATSSTPLVELAHLLRILSKDALSRVGLKVQAKAIRGRYDTTTKSWEVTFENSAITSVNTRHLFLTQGSIPRTFDLPLSSIPLDIALDPTRLRRYVTPGQRVLLFGTMHSGTLVIRNLVRDCGAKVIGLYKGDSGAFTWDRDGAYDGLKGEAAEIADSIVKGEYGGEDTVKLCSVENTAAVVRASLTSDWVIYAMGFQPRTIPLEVDGKAVSSTSYDGDTGALIEAPKAWGFGIAYPNRAPDRIHWDVSIAAFLNHMRGQLSALLALV